MGRGRARHHRVEGRVRLAGPPLQVPVGHRQRHHRHGVERLPLLLPAGTKGRCMTNITAPMRRMRCAVYTRKSSEEGLDMEFNSLDAQRESCEAYIASQRAEGWVCMRERYDDGGYSGGSLERPGLKTLLEDIEAGLVDVIVVYKIDRLSRSLMDFAKLVEAFDRSAEHTSELQSLMRISYAVFCL